MKIEITPPVEPKTYNVKLEGELTLEKIGWLHAMLARSKAGTFTDAWVALDEFAHRHPETLTTSFKAQEYLRTGKWDK